MMSQKKRKKEKPFTPVFTYGLIVVLILVFLGVLMPNKFYETASGISGFIAENLGWYYMFVTTGLDRKSTRLNSSHVSISYAVFCLKKKKELKKLTTMKL